MQKSQRKNQPKDVAPTGAERARLRFSRENEFRMSLYPRGTDVLRKPSRQWQRHEDRTKYFRPPSSAELHRQIMKERHYGKVGG